MREDYKSGFVAIIGRPNVGKSTLMNHLIGQKIAITSRKAQTTRNKIQTVYTCERGQIVFLDTPGIHKAKNKNEITQEKANCLLCKGIKAYPKEDKYIEAVAKLYEKEDEINRAKEQRKKRKIWFQKKNKQIN